jgi:hypothetical protein
MTTRHVFRPCRWLVMTGALLAVGAACIPLPEHRRVSPALVGVLRRGDSALADVPVRLATGQTTCSTTHVATRTDRTGRFRLDEQFFDSPVSVLVGDPAWGYSLCVPDGDQWTVIFRDSGIPEPPVAVDTLECDLAAFRVDSTRLLGARTACRAASHRSPRSFE